MFDKDSFDTKSFETKSWLINVIEVIVTGVKRVAAKLPTYLRNKAPNFLLRK